MMRLQKKTDEFIHRMGVHCESAVTSSLLFNHGLEISEPLIFGIGSGICFGYFPFLKAFDMPLIAYRTMPGRIMKNTAKRLGVNFKAFTFRDPEQAMHALDELIDEGNPVCVRTGMYWLPYVDEPARVNFNLHHIVVYGRKEDNYLISDPICEGPVTCSREDLMRARFSKGSMAPQGFMFYLPDAPPVIDYLPAIRKGIREVCHVMIHFPFPLIGVRGIKTFAGIMRRWPEKYDPHRATVYLAHTIRMQEQASTGGGGFRLMYAAFLHEVAHLCGDDRYMQISKRMIEVGDLWREFAVHGARICKNRASDQDNLKQLSDIILDCAAKEHQLYKDLWGIVR